MTQPIRGSDVFLKADIEAILCALWMGNAAALKAAGGNAAYAQGYAMAWAQMATALGMGRELGAWRQQIEWDEAQT